MSSSFRKGFTSRHCRIALLATFAACGVAPAMAADVSYNPFFEARAETNTNRNLSPTEDEERDATGYIGELGLLMTARTPRSDTRIRPKIRVQDYDDTSKLEKVEGFLELYSEYRQERGQFDVSLEASHEDLYNAELGDAAFPDVDPTDPTSPESGNLDAGETRDRVRVMPRYTHEVSERSSLGGDIVYEAAYYDADPGVELDATDYQFGKLDAWYGWKMSPTSDLRIGPYASVFEGEDDANDYDAYGVEVGYQHSWSERTMMDLELSYEQNDIDYFDPAIEDTTESGYGALLTILRKGEVSSLRFVAGQTFTPSSRGEKLESDQVRVQYDRDFSAKLSFRGAARYLQESGIGDALDQSSDRDYARLDLSVRYRFTPTWYLTAGYRYIWQDRERAVGDADNNSFMLGFGYDRKNERIQNQRIR
jgi:hypothetical protein